MRKYLLKKINSNTQKVIDLIIEFQEEKNMNIGFKL